MIVSERMAQECWDLLRSFARLSDERWDADYMSSPLGRTEVDVRDAFWAAAKYAHPDRGGDPAQFALVDRAKEAMLVFIKCAAPDKPTVPHGVVAECPRCFGSGHIVMTKGFNSKLRVQCPSCRGSGELTDERQEESHRNG